MAKTKPDPADEPGGESQTSGRLYTADLSDLRRLAGLLEISSAEAYRRYAAPVIRKVLQAEAGKVARGE